jgi:lysophospholipase L1-like esterase
MRSSPAVRDSKLLLLVVSTVATLALCESVLQIALYLVQNSGYFFFTPRLKAVFHPTPELMPGVSGLSTFITESHGVRGDELTADYSKRILAIGASTTICEYLDQGETWPSLLQQLLNDNDKRRKVWVGNAGVSGLSSRHHLVALTYFPFKKLGIDTVTLLMGVNDMTFRLSHEHDYDPAFMDRPDARSELLAQTFTGTFDSYNEDPFHKRTALWQLLRRAKRTLVSRNVQDSDGRIYATWRKHRQQASEVRFEMPDLSTALGEYERNINQMIDIGKEKSIRLVFLTQPSMWKVGLAGNLESLLWLGGVGDFQNEQGKPYYSVGALAKGMRQYNDTLLKVCRQRQVECLDLAAELEKDSTVFYDDIHFNENGARHVARNIFRYLRQQKQASPATHRPPV